MINSKPPLPIESDLQMPTSDKHVLSGWRFKTLIIVIILSVIGYALFSLWGGLEDVASATMKVGIVGCLVALFLSLINYLIRFVRWQTYLGVLGYHIPILPSLRIYMAGFALTTTPGKAGEALRSVFLRDYGMPYRRSFGAFLAERLSDLLAVMVVSACGLWVYPDARPVVLIVAAIVFTILLVVQKENWLRAVEQFIKKRVSKRFGHIVEFVLETIIAFRCCYNIKMLIYGTALGILAWGAEGLAFYFLLHLLGSDIGFFTAQFIYSFAMFIGAITMLPGGLGGVEVTMLQLLLLNGVEPSICATVTIIIRLATLWFSVILGLLCLPKTVNIKK